MDGATVEGGDAGDLLTDEVLGAYISGFTADAYYTVTEDTASEAFVAETRYRVTDVTEPAPTIAVHYPDPSLAEPLSSEVDEEEGMIEEIREPHRFEPEAIGAVQEYLGGICEPLLESAEPHFEETMVPLSAQSVSVDIVLRGADGSAVAIAVCEEAHVDDGYHTEQLKETLTAEQARFGVLVTEENSEPDNWSFYELVDNTELQTRTRAEFEGAVSTQLEASKGPLAAGEILTQDQWEQFIQRHPDLETELFWHVIEVFDDECPLVVGQDISDADYQRAYNDFPARPIAAEQRLSPEERESLAQTVRDLKTEKGWHITAVFDSECTLSVDEDVSDADYQKARQSVWFVHSQISA